MGANLGHRRPGSPTASEDLESASVQQPPSASSSPLRRSVSESCFGSLLGRKAISNVLEEEPLMKASSPGLHQLRSRFNSSAWKCCRWHGTQILTALILGAMLSYTAFTLSMRSRRTELHVPHVLEPSKDCPKQPQGIALTPLALKSMGSAIVPDRLIVAARHNEDTAWLDIYLSDVPHVVYQVDDPKETKGAQHATLANKGNEAMAYLQFIIDYYDRLPASIAFIHAHRGAWHMLDHVPVLQRLRWAQHGYASMRYKNSPGNRLDWECKGRTENPVWGLFDCDWEGSTLRPGNVSLRKEADIIHTTKDMVYDSMEMQLVWNQTFAAELGPLPDHIQAPCCSEFLVARDRILMHPRSFYIKLRDWIIETEVDRYRTGRVMEYTWHSIFGEPYVIEALKECDLLYCDKNMN